MSASEQPPPLSTQPPLVEAVPPSIPHPLIDNLQRVYEDHRVPETWHTPSTSHGFFDTWRNDGLVAAGKYLVAKEQVLGDPSLSPAKRIGALGLGVAAVVVADKLIGHKNAQPGQPEGRVFGKTARAAALYAGGVALLLAANEGQSSGGGHSYSEFSDEVEEAREKSSWEDLHSGKIDFEDVSDPAIDRFLKYETIDDAINAARLDGINENEFLNQMMEGTGTSSYGELADQYGEGTSTSELADQYGNQYED